MNHPYQYYRPKNGRTGILKKGSCSFVYTFLLSSVLLASAFIPVSAAESFHTIEEINIRTGPGVSYDVLELVPADYSAVCEEEVTAEDGSIWYRISVDGETGYILSDYTEEDPEVLQEVPVESEDIEEDIFEGYSEEFIEALFAPGYQDSWSGAVQSDWEFAEQVNEFPESYREGLWRIHSIYPNYRFTADYTGMDFQTLVDEEDYKKVHESSSPSYKAMYDESFGYYENYDWENEEWINSEGAFTLASREIIEYYLDPRNFLNTYDIFMFMRQSYSGDVSEDDVRSFLEGTFLARGYTPNPEDPDDVRLDGDYAQVLLEAAGISGVSPFVLATTIFSEQGYQGQTDLISGFYESDSGDYYIGLYNFYNFGATGTDHDDVVVNGLLRARSEGWTSRYRSIVDGAVLYGDNYILNGQDTYYYKNFNVMNGWNGLWHQYATAIVNSYTSGVIMREVYADSTYAALEFRIPVYENMPAVPSGKPEANDSLNNYYFSDMKATGLEPAFSMSNRNYTMAVTQDATLSIKVPKWASYEGYDAYALYPGENLIRLDVRSQTGYLRTYNITVTSSGEYTLYVDVSEGSRLTIADDGSGWADANGDGKVSALDYIAIKNHIMETRIITDPERLTAADANGDGRISALDYIAIKQYIMSR